MLPATLSDMCTFSQVEVPGQRAFCPIILRSWNSALVDCWREFILGRLRVIEQLSQNEEPLGICPAA